MSYKETHNKSCSLSAAIGLVILLSFNLYAASADLDATFGNGGIVISPFTQYSDWISSIHMQPDGKIVVTGYSYDYDPWCPCDYPVSGFIARYNSSGTLDTSFGTNGIISDFGSRMILQPDGKIVSIGTHYITNSAGTLIVGADFYVSRYNAAGAPDASFGKDGNVTTSIQTYSYAIANDVVLRPDGKIVVMGSVGDGGRGGKFGIVRYNPDGSLDTSFGTLGQLVTDISSDGYVAARWMLIQHDGKIVIGGDFQQRQGGLYYYHSILVRYNSDGSLDSGFGTNGKVDRLLPGYDAGLHSVLQPDGKIVVTGAENFTNKITRFNADGSVDASFADNGSFTPEYGLFGNNIVLQPDGKIIAFGGNSFAALRLNPDGSPDSSFGTNGRAITPVGTNNSSFGMAVALQPDGKIVAGGVANYSNGLGDAAIVRYVGDSTATHNAKADFDGDWRTDISVYRPSDGNWYVLNSGASPPYSVTNWGNTTDIPAPADFDDDGRTDISIYRPSTGQWFIVNSKDSSFTIADWGTAGDKPAPRDFDGDGRADISVYRPSNGTWYIFRSNGSGWDIVQWGGDNDVPVPGRYDPDDKTDIAVYRPSTEQWFVLPSLGGGYAANWGTAGDKPVPADYDGDGKDDIAVYRPSDGNWYIYRSNGTGYDVINWGVSTDTPVPGDYDGDTKDDIAQYRPSAGQWFILKSTGGYVVTNWGTAGDQPSPASYIP